MPELDFRLLNDFQRSFPLVPEPYRELAARIGTDEASVLRRLRRLAASGAVSRIGAVFAPRSVGASTLACLAAPAAELSRIAALVSAHDGVNHNYEREHRFNLWFVATAGSEARLGDTLERIGRETGCRVLALPLVEEYHIDLGFDMTGPRAPHATRPASRTCGRFVPDADERRLLAALERGFDLVPRPYVRLAMKAGMREEQVMATLARWQAEGVVKRLGVVVRHRALGYAANAMAVWDVPDDRVDELGMALAAEAGVTLCYRRVRHPPQWPYNLFCMLHGRTRLEVEGAIAALRDRHGLHAFAGAVLFSRRCFKQRGARYFDSQAGVHG